MEGGVGWKVGWDGMWWGGTGGQCGGVEVEKYLHE